MTLNLCFFVSFETVTFDFQGSGEAESVSGVTSGSAIAAPAAPARSGYTFGGWYRDKTSTAAWNFSTDKVTGNMTLYAKWTYNDNDDDSSSGGSNFDPIPESQPTPSPLLNSDGSVSVPVTPKLDSSTLRYGTLTAAARQSPSPTADMMVLTARTCRPLFATFAAFYPLSESPSLIWTLRILPLMVLGSSVTNSMIRGYL